MAVAAQSAYDNGIAACTDRKVYGRLERSGAIAQQHRELRKGVDRREIVSSLENQMVFLGLTAMSDRICAGVPEAIQACHTAGIRVVMITGDYALTAASIGHQIGLGDGVPLPLFLLDQKLRRLRAYSSLRKRESEQCIAPDGKPLRTRHVFLGHVQSAKYPTRPSRTATLR